MQIMQYLVSKTFVFDYKHTFHIPNVKLAFTSKNRIPLYLG
jgi:hypothetical protein